MTHYEYSKQHGKLNGCTPQMMNFGGSCFNCGYDPEVHGKLEPKKDKEKKDDPKQNH